MKALIFGLIIGLSIIVVGCRHDKGKKGDDDNNSSNDNNETNGYQMAVNLNVNFDNIKGFTIAPALTDSDEGSLTNYQTNRILDDSTATSQVLYSINKDDTLSVVTVVSDSTSSNEQLKPDGIVDTLKYTFFSYDGCPVKHEENACCIVAARKSDSALFCLTLAGGVTTTSYYQNVVSDPSGDIIFVRYWGGSGSHTGAGIARLDFSDPSSPIQTILSDPSSDGNVGNWAVNSDGDIFLETNTVYTGNTNLLRMYKSSGGIQNFGNTGSSLIFSGVGSDSKTFYYMKPSTTSDASWVLHEITKSGDKFTSKIYFKDIIDDSNKSKGLFAYVNTLAKTNNRIFAPSNATDFFVELVGPSGPQQHDVSAYLTIVTAVYGYKNGVIILGTDADGNSGLLRYTTGPNSVELLKAGDYSLCVVSVGSQGEVSFGGRRNSDNMRILGTIPAPPDPSEVKIVTERLSGDVQQIVNLNE